MTKAPKFKNRCRTPIYFEWTKNSFDNQNNRKGSYANLSYTRGKIFYSGEWEYNANGEPTPKEGYTGL